IGLKCHVPKGTFYAFPALPKGFQGKSMEFCQGLLQAEKVAVVPGTAFGPSGEGFFRASFSNSYEQLIAATTAIERYVGSLGL
ncbi:MAG: aminotransferase class I/II-fold pyridoxal phosphate-dependent enzyme, partial [Verrucomicrobiota bacterium JB024]|nr:aminotransferase class I/II-fold pyridoxal phosphate-dependent enzyme [Verrucomicrobiota bacterium JB024]